MTKRGTPEKGARVGKLHALLISAGRDQELD
jgi:hypothetical protein